MDRQNILFIDRYNLTTSIIAESYLRRVGGLRFNINSAGIDEVGASDRNANRLYKCTRNVVSELSLPLLGIRAGTVADDFLYKHHDYVILIGDYAKRKSPTFLGSYIRVDWEWNEREISPGDMSELSEEEVTNKLRFLRFKVISNVDSFLQSFTPSKKKFF